MKRLSPSTLAHILLLAVVLVWGATFTLIKDTFADISPLLFNTLRMAFAFLALAIVNHRAMRSINRRAILSGLVVGAFLAIGYQFQTAGLARTSPAKCAFITGLIVVFVPIFTAFPALRPPGAHAPGWNAALGAVLAFIGLLLLTTPAGTPWASLFSSIGTGDLLTLACAVCFPAHLLALARTSPRVPIPQLATLQIGFAALVSAATLPLGGPLNELHLTITTRLIIALAITSLLATAAAFTIQSWAQKHLPPTHTAILLTFEPVFAWLTSLIFFHERLGARSLLGAGLILTGIVAAELLATPTPVPTYPS